MPSLRKKGNAVFLGLGGGGLRNSGLCLSGSFSRNLIFGHVCLSQLSSGSSKIAEYWITVGLYLGCKDLKNCV